MIYAEQTIGVRPAPLTDPPAHLGRRHRWKHVLAVGWLVATAVAVLAPALTRGASFGSFDLLSQLGVLQQHGVAAHNLQAGDQADATIPWATLAWRQVHHGQLPLWNPYGALGMPLTFNWQAGSFSVPALISYLFPQNLLTTIQVFLTLIIAGIGVYVLGRVLRLTVLSCVFAATVFELSGPMVGWLGWIHAAAMAWAGWLFAAALLIVRGGRRVRCVAFFALVLTALIYAGSPEILVLIGLSLAIVLVVLLAYRTRQLGGSGPIVRPIVDLCLAAVAGIALGAPLLLPGIQVISVSERGVTGGDPAELIPGNPPLPPHNLVHLIIQRFDGLPVAGIRWFAYTLGYSETAAYVGLIALVLAITAIAVRRRRPEVIAFGLLAVAMVCIAFVPPVVSLLTRLPVVGTVLWQRALLPLALGIAVLAGFGMDALVRAHDQRKVTRWAGGGFAVAAALLVALWAFGRGDLPSAEATIRARSFVWPTIEVALGLALIGILALTARRSRMRRVDGKESRFGIHRWVAVSLIVVETAFLVTSGAPLVTSSSTFFATTPAEVSLQRAVGQSIVGFGAPLCFFAPGLGITPNAQLAYGIQELGLYDPLIPNAYFTSWSALTHRPAGNANDSAYCPVITTAEQARLYGVGFVLERLGIPGPQGTQYDAKIGDEVLYRVPNSASATITPIPATGKPPAVDARSRPVSVSHPDPASWKLTTDATSSQVLRLRLTDLPGWHANIDGKAVPLRRFAGVMLQMDVPPGHHVVKLYYWPATFTVGLILAACSLTGLTVALILESARYRRRRLAVMTSGDLVNDVSAGAPLP